MWQANKCRRWCGASATAITHTHTHHTVSCLHSSKWLRSAFPPHPPKFPFVEALTCRLAWACTGPPCPPLRAPLSLSFINQCFSKAPAHVRPVAALGWARAAVAVCLAVGLYVAVGLTGCAALHACRVCVCVRLAPCPRPLLACRWRACESWATRDADGSRRGPRLRACVRREAGRAGGLGRACACAKCGPTQPESRRAQAQGDGCAALDASKR